MTQRWKRRSLAGDVERRAQLAVRHRRTDFSGSGQYPQAPGGVGLGDAPGARVVVALGHARVATRYQVRVARVLPHDEAALVGNVDTTVSVDGDALGLARPEVSRHGRGGVPCCFANWRWRGRWFEREVAAVGGDEPTVAGHGDPHVDFGPCAIQADAAPLGIQALDGADIVTTLGGNDAPGCAHCPQRVDHDREEPVESAREGRDLTVRLDAADRAGLAFRNQHAPLVVHRQRHRP